MSYKPTPRKNEDAPHTTGDPGVPILGVRQDTDVSPVGADGDYHNLLFNNVGRLKTATMPGDYTATVDDITAIADTVTCDVGKASNVMLYCTGTFSTVNCTFEGSIDGGTTWFGVQAIRSNANTIETTTGNLSAAPAYGWEMSVNAMTHVRVRCTALTSGTQTWRILPGSFATEPIPGVQTHAVTGSGNFAVTMAAHATNSPPKARDGVAGASDTGIPALLVRRDTPTAVTPAAGDWEIPQIDANGSQWVRLAGEIADNAAFTDGTTRVVPTGYIYDEVAGTGLTENDTAAARIDVKRAQVNTIEDATTRGQRLAVSAAGAAKVDGSAVTQPVSGTVTINTIPAGNNNIGDVDIASAIPAGNNNIGDVDVATLPVAFNTGTRSATTQRVTIATDDVVPASQSGAWTVGLSAGTNTNEVVGDVAEDAALAGNPVRQGVRASAAVPAAMSADNDVVTPWGDRSGRQVITSKAGTPALTNVAASATSVTVLAANTSRLGATIVNDSSALLYLKFGATASTTSYTVVLAGTAAAPFAYYEVPFGYTGIIDGIWASATGNARVTELT